MLVFFLAGPLWAEPVIHESSNLPARNQLPLELQERIPSQNSFEGYQEAFRQLASFYRTSDGVEILTDEQERIIWFRHRTENEWQLVRRDAAQVRVLGGEFNRLSFNYMGKGIFIFPVTIDGSERTYNPVNDERPSALCETLLVDGTDGSILDRTRALRYYSQPRVRIAPEWLREYGLTTYKETSDYDMDLGILTKSDTRL